MLTQDAIRPPTIRELMSHTTGLGYGLFDVHPIERAYREAGVMMANSHEDLVRRAATIPLMFEPGTEWFYSIATDLQALVVERLSGQTFGEFLRTRIFAPLGMVDTGFYVPGRSGSPADGDVQRRRQGRTQGRDRSLRHADQRLHPSAPVRGRRRAGWSQRRSTTPGSVR